MKIQIKKTAFIFSLLIAIVIKGYSQTSDTDAVKKVLNSYKSSIENLSVSGISELFVKNSEIVESGSVEGTIDTYLEHHLGPELKEFKSFKFNDYTVKVELDGNFAFGTEKYVYVITLRDGREIKKRGVATSVLEKTQQGWKIKSTHSSSRNAK
ncbi:YybH family protein [Pedobacter nutrimenti]|uniref:Ketosteroid isomerase-like protein n=1 Tax=Pedobacter nutrimenti TaxID=1241337 RepID=A0A318UH71_9SPHI|nr:nuclear transport factor 2 family protein [Pedobacter nutrimenti]PYF74667.1 ketosteroid isomerase-like protein [Pedobacter nutrimenti]